MGKKSICIITFPYGKSGVIPSANFVTILNDIFDEVHVITSEVFDKNHVKKENSHVHVIESNWGGSKLKRIKNFLRIQIGISIKIIKLRRKFKQCIFFMGGDISLIPILTSKLLNKRVILCLPGSTIEVSSKNKEMNNFKSIIKFLVFICMYLSDIIVLYSSLLIDEWNLGRFKRKIVILHRHFLDFNKFKSINDFQLHKRNMIGFIGRFEEEKGIINFLNAIPIILKYKRDIRFLIVGDGVLKYKIQEYVDNEQLNDKVMIKDWIDHDKLPYYLNKLELIVVPSFTEGLPNIVIESMACGTPVLVNNVGAIPDIIEDENNGFLINDNSPQSIVNGILKVLDYRDVKFIICNAQDYVRRNFNYKKVVENWEKFLQEKE